MAALALGASLLTSGAQAAPVCNSTKLTINVSATAIVFGNYSPGSSLPTLSNGTVNVYCSNVTNWLPSFTVALSAGEAGSFNPRQMSSGGSTKLNYNIYTDGTYSTVWGDGTSGTAVQSYSQSQKLGQISYTSYGQIPAQQYVSSGSYTDTITVTVTY